MYVPFGGWLESLPDFDASMFRLSSSEAVCLDPQSRMLLEHAADLLRWTSQAAKSSVGVYVGCMYTGGWLFCVRTLPRAQPEVWVLTHARMCPA